MKILLIECDAEELRANRTILDSITEVISEFTRGFVGIELTPEQVADGISKMNNEENQDEE